MISVLLIDESFVSRDGYSNAIAQDEGLEVTDSLTHREALEADLPPHEVALVNLADPRADHLEDDFVGIGVVKRLLHTGTTRPRLVVGYTSFSNHKGLLLRARRVGVDLVFSREELEHAPGLLPERLLRHVEFGETHDPSRLVDNEVFALGISHRTALEAAIRSAGVLLARFGDLDDLGGHRNESKAQRARAAFGSAVHLEARNTDGGVKRGHPPWDQLRRLWEWAAKAPVESVPPRYFSGQELPQKPSSAS